MKLRILGRKILSEDLKIILVFMFVLVSIWATFPLAMGWFASDGVGFNTPSVGNDKRAAYQDSDNDLLPDVIEKAPKGQKVYVDGVYVGTGTGTDPNKKDTDGDLFTDNSEDNLGTDANSWINPGGIWILWAASIVYIIYYRYFRKEDKLREYRDFDQLQSSGGVSDSGSKYAYGGGSIFTKRASEMSADERKKVIQQDARYHQIMSGEARKSDRPSKTQKKIKKVIPQIIIAVIATIIIRFYVTR